MKENKGTRGVKVAHCLAMAEARVQVPPGALFVDRGDPADFRRTPQCPCGAAA